MQQNINIKRIALIIGAPGKPNSDEYLHGVKSDLNNYINFLTAPEGGAWRIRDEIFIIEDATKRQILREIYLLNRERPLYTLVAFSGHGGASSPIRDFIWTQDNEKLDSSELWINAPKRTLILDSCRVPMEEQILESAQIKAGMESFSDHEGLLNYSRKLFFEKVQKPGIPYIKINSCSYNECAGDNSLGGYFTFNFLDIIRKWSSSHDGVFSLQNAFSLTKTQVAQETNGEQNPDLHKPRMLGTTPPIGIGMKMFYANIN